MDGGLAERPVRWPAAFGRRFLVTVDTEEEFDWSAPFSPAARSVAAIAALPAMHRRLADAGVAPLYFVDHPVAADPDAAAIVRDLVSGGGGEVGTQLHPWVNPPFDAAAPLESFAGRLPRALEAAKLDRLTDTIAASFGAAPRAYRAGRYGIGPNTLALLAARGYRVDSSERSGFDYRGEGGPDHSRVAATARFTGPVLRLPLSTIFTGALGERGRALHRAAGRVPLARGALARLGLVWRVPLTPEGTPLAEALAAVRAAAAADLRLLILSFHSPSLVPGNTPYVRDAADRAAFDGWWDAVLPALGAAGYTPASLADVLDAASLASGADVGVGQSSVGL